MESPHQFMSKKPIPPELSQGHSKRAGAKAGAKRSKTAMVIAVTLGAVAVTIGLFALAKKLKNWLPEDELYE